VLVTENGESNELLLWVTNTNNMIYFVSPTGRNTTRASGGGTYDNPFETINYGVSQTTTQYMILYCGTENGQVINNAGLNLGDPTVSFTISSSDDRSVIAYPGVTAWVKQGGGRGVTSQLYMADARVPVANTARIIGNYISNPSGDGANGTIHGSNGDMYILGNHFDKCGADGSDKLFHTIYINGWDNEIAWNRFTNSQSNRAIQFNSDGAGAEAHLHKIHDNYFYRQRGNAINLAAKVHREFWIYNNVIVECGIGPTWATSGSFYGINIWDNDWSGLPAGDELTVYIYNNLIKDCGYDSSFGVVPDDPDDPGAKRSSGLISWEPKGVGSVYMYNNIFMNRNNAYFNSELNGDGSGYPGASVNGVKQDAYGNIFFGRDGMPDAYQGWDTAAVYADPKLDGFGLQADSPAIGKAVFDLEDSSSFFMPKYDFNGVKGNRII